MKKQQKQAKKLGVAVANPKQVSRQGAAAGVQSAKSFAAAAYASGQKMREPSIQASKGSVRIRHRELVATIAGSVAFTVGQQIVTNPGLSASFPWLATQASGWEQYRFHKLCYQLITRAPTTATGSVLIVPDYDVLDPLPTTEQVASTFRDAVEDAPWKDQNCVLDMSAMFGIGPRKYVRSGLVVGTDQKTYDGAQVFVCTVGQADTSSIGKLWAEYDVEFFVPQTITSGAISSPSTFAQFNLSAAQGLTTGVAATLAFDQVVINALGIVNSSGTFTLPQGNWHILMEVAATGGTSALQSLQGNLEKNGAALAVPCVAFYSNGNNSAVAGQGAMWLCFSGFIQSSGSDTCRLRVTSVSAAGVLTAVGNECRISFRVV